MSDLHPARTALEAAGLRARIDRHTLRPEADSVADLLADWSGPDAALRADTDALGRRLVEAARAHQQRRRGLGVDALMHGFPLDAEEGVALMCIAEALLRIPDTATRDALIRDRLSGTDWRAGLADDSPLFLHAAAWGLLAGGRMVDAPVRGGGLGGAARRVLARGGEPVLRQAMAVAMRLLGERFVAGRDIDEAIALARPREAEGWRFSYDMLGEAAVTEACARRYFDAYMQALHAVGKGARGETLHARAGLSVKLSALHPRYVRAQRERVLDELVPRLLALAQAAQAANIGLNVDAEEADRLGLSLEVFERVALDASVAGFAGLGFVVQAYGHRAPAVIDWLEHLAVRRGAPLMVRLVKGAYWDQEIRRAQTQGLDGFPVFTRKAHTDLSWLVCARRLLARADRLYPQFATHNAHSLALVDRLAARMGEDRFEFQCLHGMGETLHGAARELLPVARACRVYAPVGSHETLLPYLVRRLLENGANSSFVHRLVDAAVPVEALLADPFDAARADGGRPHPDIPAPHALHAGERDGARGSDLADEAFLADWAAALQALDATGLPPAPPQADADAVGATLAALRAAADAREGWAGLPAAARAVALRRAADLVERDRLPLMHLLVREAGKTLSAAQGEVREAVDFLRFHAAEAGRHAGGAPLGVAACISPWNFPLAIFAGQVTAALAAGNLVAAKPAEQTPRVAQHMVALLHEAGVPPEALVLLPGDGERVGAPLAGDARVDAVLFTGSTQVARHIGRAQAALPPGPVERVLVAETGGQNAMVVDASALPEQVVLDALSSGFDSAGQRCSALRLLCVQEEIADRVSTLLREAMLDLRMGDPGLLATDVGPVIDVPARDAVEAHVAAMAAAGLPVHRAPLPVGGDARLVAPTLVELDRVSRLEQEIFGPVVHLVRWRRETLDALLAELAATGYALTFGVQSRIRGFVDRVVDRVPAGNVYVNRNIVGAVVGVQPFGGEALSGTGPKAGGPLMVARLQRPRTLAPSALLPGREADTEPPSKVRGLREDAPARRAAVRWLAEALTARGDAPAAARLEDTLLHDWPGRCHELSGPAGERNLWMLLPRGTVRVDTDDVALPLACGLAIATGNTVAMDATRLAATIGRPLPASLRDRLVPADTPVDAVLAGDDALRRARLQTWAYDGVPVPAIDLQAPDATLRLLKERSLSVNLAASGGDPVLMSLRD